MTSPTQDLSDNLQTDPQPSTTSKDLIQHALKTNKSLQQSLARRAEQLEAELNELDGLLTLATTTDGNEDPESEVFITGSKKATGLFPATQFLNLVSPFHTEANARVAYLNNTNPRPLKGKELELLTEAVKRENARLEAYRLVSSENPGGLDLTLNVEGLDWARIAQYVSDESSVKRTALECRICWLGDKHPSINHSEWTEDETKRVNDIVSEAQKAQTPVDWVAVAKELGTNRRPIDCMKQTFNRPRHSWTPEADQKLLEAVESCGIDNWHVVATLVSEHVTPSQCQNRWCRTVNPELRRGAWTTEEDELLKKAVAAWGTAWMQIATHIPGRNNDQCRDRWAEYLSPSSSQAPWTEEEDKKLVEYVAEMKNQWKAIGLKIGNRTGHSCRIRYDKLKRMEKAAEQDAEANEESNQKKATTQPKPRKRTKAATVDSAQASITSGDATPTESQEPNATAQTPTNAPSAADTSDADAVTGRPRPKPRPRKKAATVTPSSETTSSSAESTETPQPSTSSTPTGKRPASKTTGSTRTSKRSKLSHSVTTEDEDVPSDQVAAAEASSSGATLVGVTVTVPPDAPSEPPASTTQGSRRSTRVRTSVKKG